MITLKSALTPSLQFGLSVGFFIACSAAPGRTEGDAASGGIYRELVTPETAEPAR